MIEAPGIGAQLRRDQGHRQDVVTRCARVSPARIERDVLDLLAHRRAPFVAKLRCAFQSMERLLLMDYYPSRVAGLPLASRSFRRSDARQAAQKVGAELAAALTQIHAFRVVRVRWLFGVPLWPNVTMSLVDQRGHRQTIGLWPGY